ncbi:sensor histidine kinase [Coralloluteibacterium thermophilus]|uniref:histidine kinase n=1 Tax=Coralloluteibacterium thermophilum TaxID=2707049 RepID=A0ABV9NPD2_9GAMM
MMPADVPTPEQNAAQAELAVVALYAEIEDQAERLRQASELKSRFLSHMSHEFRAPLGAIRSMARLLLDEVDGPLAGEQRVQVEFIAGAATEMSEMVDDLLDLARVEAGRISISPGWFTLVDVFAALRGMFRPIVANGAVQLVFEDPGALPRMYSDDRKLSQILRNFISNALKFTTRGEVRVAACRLDDGRIRFTVSDTGPGIAPEQIPTLFDEFVQVDTPLQRKFRGSGLGLAVCRRFAELLRGEVACESRLGAGSTFSVTLPERLEDVPE